VKGAISSDGEFDDEASALSYAAERAGLPISDFAAATEVNVVANGLRFHYLDWGTTGKLPVVFLHGGALNAHTYDLVCLALRADYHCIALDQRGHGDSEWSPILDYRPETQAADILGVADALGLDRFLLVGQSMGGINALHFAAAHPERLAGLVVIDTGPELSRDGARPIQEFVAATTQERDSVADFVEDALRLNPRRDRKLLLRSLRHNLRQTAAGKWVWKWDPRPRLAAPNISADAIAARRERLWILVRAIPCPTLVVRGAESEIFTEEQAAKFVDVLSNGRFARVERAGHNVQGDNPAALSFELRRFLKNIAGATVGKP